MRAPGASSSRPERGARPAETTKRCHVTTTTSRAMCGRGADVEDVLLLSCEGSQTAGEWVGYLSRCFHTICHSRHKPPYRIAAVGLQEAVAAAAATAERAARARLHIVIVCPLFLEQLHQLHQMQQAPQLQALLRPDRTLAMLLGLDEASAAARLAPVFPSYEQWHRMQVKDQDETSVGDFLATGMTILARISRQQLLKEKALFSLVPKKVNEGQSKVVVLLNEPLAKEDEIKVKVEKNGVFLDITGVKRKNPYTLYFQIPESCLEVSALVGVHVEAGGRTLGSRLLKCESRLRELERVLRSACCPLQLLCQALNAPDHQRVDTLLAGAVQRSMPPAQMSTLVAHIHPVHGPATPGPAGEEFPTLLHFAARFGLEQLAMQLLEWAGGTAACNIRNAFDQTPADVANAHGHAKLEHTLRAYVQMTEFTMMYDMLGKMTEENSKRAEASSSDYSSPRDLSDTYQIPQSTRIVEVYDEVPAARPVTPPPPVKSPVTEQEGYMEMLPQSSSHNNFSHIFGSQNLTSSSDLSETFLSSLNIKSQSHLDQMGLESPSVEERPLPAGSTVKKSRDQVRQNAQDELLEIINDFKNNVHTISEVEKLVDNWKNRNDVQRSFKEKQEQLNQMRERYEEIQQRIKSNMKRPTPFDRIRRLFKGRPKEQREGNGESGSGGMPQEGNKPLHGECGAAACTRPMSSLSVHSFSSSSSGRMSTLSGCSGASVGDSSMHSDEDRKHFCPLEISKVLGRDSMANYAVPPAPRLLSQIETRPPLPAPRPASDLYITPDEAKDGNSSQDIPATWSEAEKRISKMIMAPKDSAEPPDYLETIFSNGSAYMNVSFPEETSELPEYMNFTAQSDKASVPVPPIPPRMSPS